MIIILPMRRWDVGGVSLMRKWCAFCIQKIRASNAHYTPHSPLVKLSEGEMVIILPMKRWDVGGVSLMKK